MNYARAGILSICAGAMALAVCFVPRHHAPQPASQPFSEPQIAGPSVMLRLQREGAPVLDLRQGGRRVPGAVRLGPNRAKEVLRRVLHSPQYSRPRDVALLGDLTKSSKLAQRLRLHPAIGDVYLVPSHLLEEHTLVEVPQWTAAQLRARLPQVRVLDVSEAEEFAQAHVPGSRRVAYEALRAGDRALVPRGQPITVI